MWLKIAVGGVALLLASTGAVLLYGSWRWRMANNAIIARLHTSRSNAPRLTYAEEDLVELPGPVARYFRSVLRPGQPLVVAARLLQEGQLRIGDAEQSWRPFAAIQIVRPLPPSFVWDARIRMAPGLKMHVRDSYMGGAGSMRGELLGLVPIVDAHDTPELAAGALHRFLAEAVWFPTALLPSQALQWAAIDDLTAQATLRDGPVTVSLEFSFSAAGEITRAFTPSRYREVQGAYELTPWECRYAEYAERGGMRIPLEGEVAWHVRDRRLPYWKGQVTDVSYEYAP